MAIKNMAAALGDLEKTKKTEGKTKKIPKGKQIKSKIDKQIKSKKDKNVKYLYLTLEPAVYKKLWLHKVNSGLSISATINQLVKKHLK